MQATFDETSHPPTGLLARFAGFTSASSVFPRLLTKESERAEMYLTLELVPTFRLLL